MKKNLKVLTTTAVAVVAMASLSACGGSATSATTAETKAESADANAESSESAETEKSADAKDAKADSADKKVLKVAMECAYAPYNWTQPDDSNGAVPIADSNEYAYGYDVMMAKQTSLDMIYRSFVLTGIL